MRKTRFQQLHIIISIIAALAVTGVCVYLQVGLYTMAVWVSSAIVVFYTLGQIIRVYLENVLKPTPTEAEEILVGEEIPADETENNVYSNAYAEFDEVEP